MSCAVNSFTEDVFGKHLALMVERDDQSRTTVHVLSCFSIKFIVCFFHVVTDSELSVWGDPFLQAWILLML